MTPMSDDVMETTKIISPQLGINKVKLMQRWWRKLLTL